MVGREGGIVVVEGPAGIGKTTLLAYARARAETLGLTVATARGTELEVDYAWGCARQLFEPFTKSSTAAVLPFAGDDPAVPLGEYSIINSLFWLASDLASQNPLLIVMDDLQWADTASARFLAYLAARMDALPAVLMVALRPGSGRIDHIVSMITRLPLAVSTTLAPLTASGCAELLAGLIDAPTQDLVLRCHEATRGNPFLVRELGRQLTSRPDAGLLQGSPNIARFVAGQLAHLPEQARDVAHALAVLGDQCDGHTLARVAGMPARQALAGVASLVTSELVLADGVPARLSFAHPLIRSAVYDGIEAGALIDLHLRACRAAFDDHDPIRAATHLLRVPPGTGDVDPVAVLNQAADLSLARGSVDSAVAFLRRILDEDLGDQRLAVLSRLGMTEALVDMPQAIERLSQALALEPDPERRAEITFVLAATTWMTCRPRQAARVCQVALGRERRLSASARQALQSCIGMASYGTPDGTDLVALLDGFGAQAPDSSPGGLMLEASLSLHDAMRNRRESAERRGLRVLADDRLAGQPLAPPLLTCAWYALGPCDVPQLLPSIEAMLEQSRRTGSMRGMCPALAYRSMVMLTRGHLDEAVRDGRLSWEASKNSGLDLGQVFTADWLVTALVVRGALGEAQSILDQVKNAHGPDLNRHIYATGETRLLLAQGHVRRALAMARSTRDQCRALGVTNPEIFDWRTPLAHCLTRLGQHDEARAVAAELLSAATAWGTPRAIGRALRVAATANGKDRLDMLTESVRLLEGTEAGLEHASSRFLLGEALRQDGHLDDARVHLLTALELAAFCGARPLRWNVMAALRQVNGLDVLPVTPSRTALSPTEARIADLADAGLSDREIAEALYLTVKFVQEHRRTLP
ncbi:LuxR family transcriptional regulator [Actinomadura fulvescens]|uniref:LuxR family transcriptional regulator n=1 Tax=Actinomadura fulvescens TaxID=46160 RepID=A0ABP6CYQ8_9ACTN